MACRDWAAKVGGGVLGRVWALVAALALLLGLAAMAPAPAQAASFRDVPSGQWYTSWADQASDQGLMSGFTDPATGRPTGYFGPDEPLTRAQVATVLWRMAGMPGIHEGSLFDDVEFGAWYEAAVDWCVEAGVVTGYTSGVDEGCFRPDRPVSRQELAVMAWRYAEWAGMDTTDPDPVPLESTTDWESADSWALEALTWTAATGVLSGFDNQDGTKSIKPFGTATRAQAAKVFVVLSDQPSLPEPDKKPADGAESGEGNPGDAHDKPAYAVLYADGLLSLQRGDDTDPRPWRCARLLGMGRDVFSLVRAARLRAFGCCARRCSTRCFANAPRSRCSTCRVGTRRA